MKNLGAVLLAVALMGVFGARADGARGNKFEDAANPTIQQCINYKDTGFTCNTPQIIQGFSYTTGAQFNQILKDNGCTLTSIGGLVYCGEQSKFFPVFGGTSVFWSFSEQGDNYHVSRVNIFVN